MNGQFSGMVRRITRCLGNSKLYCTTRMLFHYYQLFIEGVELSLSPISRTRTTFWVFYILFYHIIFLFIVLSFCLL